VPLLLLADPQQRLDRDFLASTESIAGVLFVLVGVAGLLLAGGFLDNRVLPLGRFGAFFSAGAIPLLSVLLGIKVGCELRPVPRLSASPHRRRQPMISTMVLATGLALILIGISGVLTHLNILRIVIAFSLIGTGTHMMIVAIGYVANGTAPIIDRALSVADAPARAVDPIPSALVVTAIVIGLAVTAIMLAFAVRLYDSRKTLSIDAFAESKW